MNRRKQMLGVILAAILILCVGGYLAITREIKKNDQDKTSETYSHISTTEDGKQPSEASELTTQNTDFTTKPAAANSTTKGNTDSSTGYKYAYAGFNPKTVVIDKDKWYLILVNRDNILPADFSVSLSPAVKGVNEDYELDSRVAVIYNQMYNDAKKAGCYLTPCSGYRTIASQKAKFESDIQKYMNQGDSKIKATQKAALNRQPPGCSEHNTGLAMDIANVDRSFENSKEFQWLNEHAADYGFILRYPEDKSSITKVNYEPWHWRYVGVKDAKAIKASGLCLEEYLASH